MDSPELAESAAPNSLSALIRRDLARHYGHDRLPPLWRAALFKKTFTPVLTLRLYQHQVKKGGLLSSLLKPVLKILHRWASARLAIELPLGTKIGPGFRIIHGFGLVINAKAEIGEDVTVFHGVTIGQRDRVRAEGRETRHSRIGDRVMLSPYAQVLGATVGDGATVAPLTVVYEDVAPRTVVGGNPPRVLKEEAQADVRYGMKTD